MEMLWWTLVIVLFLTSLIGVVVPFIPDTLLLWAGVLLHRFALAAEGYPLLFWIGMAAATLLIIGADLLANLVFVKKYGGDKWTMLAAAAGLILAPFILGPLGVIIGPFAAVLLLEILRSQKTGDALKAAMGTVVAWLSSAFVKIVLQLVMIVWFFIMI